MSDQPASPHIVLDGEYWFTSLIDDDGRMVLTFTRQGPITVDRHNAEMERTNPLCHAFLTRLNQDLV